MNPKYATLFQTYTLNNGVTIKNRLVVAPMTHFGSQADGLISDQERTFLNNRAGDMGMFITAATLVQKDGKAFHGQPEATGEHCLDSLRPLQKSLSPNSRNLNTGFRLFLFQITTDSIQMPP